MKQQRNTQQKKLILDLVEAHHDHPTADQIYIEARLQHPTISRGTVYRNLNQLSENKDIQKVKVANIERFDCRKDKHYHVRCIECGKILDAPMQYEGTLDELISNATGFQLEGHRTTFEGVCPECLIKHSK